MRPSRIVGLALVIASLGSGRAPALAGDSAAEKALTAKGLTREGRIFVDVEAEKPVLAKIKEVRATSYAAFAAAAEKQAAAEMLQMQSAQLDEQRLELQANLNALNQQISAQNSTMNYGRYGRMARMMPNPLQAQHQQVQAALNQTNTMQKSVRSQIPSAKDKATIDADVKKKGDTFKTALTELRTMVDDVTKRYAELGNDATVKKSLADLEKTGHAKITLGPSDAFTAGMKELDHAERTFLGKKTAAPAKKKTTKAKK